MKTVFLMFSRGFVARNILRTDVFRILKERDDLRIVLFVPRNIPDYFRAEVAGKNVILEESDEMAHGLFRRKVFTQLMLHLVYTNTSRFMMRHSGRVSMGKHRKPHGRVSFLLLDTLYTTLSRIRPLKRVFRWIEQHAYPDKVFDPYFRKYAPDLVFATTIASKRDIAMVKAAKRAGVRTVGMTRGWDNLDRFLLQTVPDRLIVQLPHMRDLAVRLHDVPADRVSVTGFPQFDLYQRQGIYRPREEFLRSLGLDPSRRLILYGSEGQWGPHDEHIVRILHRLVQEDAFPFPCSVIIRPHFSDVYEDRFKEFKGTPHTHVDANFRLSKFFNDMSDPSRAEMEHLANEFKHADVLVTMASTLSLEAALFDTPIVNIDFYAGTEPDRGPYFGRWYDSHHYRGVVETGGVRLVKSPADLKEAVAAYLTDPSRDREGRARLVEEYCFSRDGKAGERIAALLLKELGLSA